MTEVKKETEEVTVPSHFTGALVGKLIEEGLARAAKNKNNTFTQKDVAKVTATVKKEVVPVVTNMTNQEPLSRSRVVVGTVISMLFMGIGFVGYQLDLVQPGEITDFVLDAVALAGAGYALYGRLKAGLKPIGE